jgi:hypothetical protein
MTASSTNSGKDMPRECAVVCPSSRSGRIVMNKVAPAICRRWSETRSRSKTPATRSPAWSFYIWLRDQKVVLAFSGTAPSGRGSVRLVIGWRFILSRDQRERFPHQDFGAASRRKPATRSPAVRYARAACTAGTSTQPCFFVLSSSACSTVIWRRPSANCGYSFASDASPIDW